MFFGASGFMIASNTRTTMPSPTSAPPISPRLIRGGLVVLDARTGTPGRIITLQYNPDTLSRSLQIQASGADGGDRSELLRLKAPPVETIKFDAELDATDQLEFPGQSPLAVRVGLFPQLAQLETLVYPGAAALTANNQRAAAGELEIIPVEAALTLFVWSKSRVVPVRITELSITEEAFDAGLNPIRAKISLGLRVLSINDVGFQHKTGSLFMAYLSSKEQLAAAYPAGSLSALGLTGIP
jgi:hypothetical protein